jgi:hypothetical protein
MRAFIQECPFVSSRACAGPPSLPGSRRTVRRFFGIHDFSQSGVWKGSAAAGGKTSESNGLLDVECGLLNWTDDFTFVENAINPSSMGSGKRGLYETELQLLAAAGRDNLHRHDLRVVAG